MQAISMSQNKYKQLTKMNLPKEVFNTEAIIYDFRYKGEEKVFKKLDDVIYIDSANSEYEGNIYITTKKNGIQQSNLRSQCYKFDLDKHPLDVSCQEQAAKGNVQFLVTNAKMAVSILEHCNALIMYQLKEGVQLVNRFETVFYD